MSKGFLTLIEREIYRFVRLSRQTIFPPIVTTLLFIFVFGFSLGSKIQTIHDIRYIIYILPGLCSMSVITNAYANTSTSLFMSRMDKSIENMLTAPVTFMEMVGSLVLGGVLRGLVIGLITLIVAIFSIGLQVEHWGFTILILLFSSIIFSCLGIISALRAQSWDHIATFTNFIMTPLIYLGGVFYSIDQLPGFWHKISLLNPIFYVVDALRFTILNHSSSSIYISCSVLLGFSVCTFSICVWMFKKGYRLLS